MLVNCVPRHLHKSAAVGITNNDVRDEWREGVWRKLSRIGVATSRSGQKSAKKFQKRNHIPRHLIGSHVICPKAGPAGIIREPDSVTEARKQSLPKAVKKPQLIFNQTE